MLYLIGLGLNEKGISLEGLEAVKKCRKVYLEGYTVDFPYPAVKLEKVIKKKAIKLNRADVESSRLVKEAKKGKVALLVYGSPLFATTHISLLMDCEKAKVKTKIIYSASVFDAVSEIGLQIYKFGKTASMPRWQKNFEPDSFLDYIIENKKINAHSLILADIGLSFEKAFLQLEEAIKRKEGEIKLNRILVCSNLGNENSDIFYGTLSELKRKKIKVPFCFIVPADMHFVEKECAEKFT